MFFFRTKQKHSPKTLILKQREKETCFHVKRHNYQACVCIFWCHCVLFYPQAIIHVRQLKEDLQKERERHDNYMKSSSEKMEKERETLRDACREEVSGLVNQLNFKTKMLLCNG